MTLSEANAILNRLSYKPKWKFELRSEGLSSTIIVKAWVRNSLPPHSDGYVYHTSGFPPINDMSEDRLVSLVRDYVRRAELHEIDEYFKLDGKLINDPHKHER